MSFPIDDLPMPGTNTLYWTAIKRIAEEEHFDGCTGVPDFYLDACLEHDYHYRHRKTLLGDSITQADADERFRLVIQHLSPFGILSPMSWWRWIALRIAGSFAWRTKTR